jgi:hypothetical protein
MNLPEQVRITFQSVSKAVNIRHFNTTELTSIRLSIILPASLTFIPFYFPLFALLLALSRHKVDEGK